MDHNDMPHRNGSRARPNRVVLSILIVIILIQAVVIVRFVVMPSLARSTWEEKADRVHQICKGIITSAVDTAKDNHAGAMGTYDSTKDAFHVQVSGLVTDANTGLDYLNVVVQFQAPGPYQVMETPITIVDFGGEDSDLVVERLEESLTGIGSPIEVLDKGSARPTR